MGHRDIDAVGVLYPKQAGNDLEVAISRHGLVLFVAVGVVTMLRGQLATLIQRRVDLIGGQTKEVAVPADHRRTVCTRREALFLDQRELTIGAGLACFDAKPLLKLAQRLVSAGEHARDVGAHHQHLLPDRLPVEHRVEGRDAEDVRAGHRESRRHQLEYFFGQITELVLRLMQNGQASGLGIGVATTEVADLGVGLGGELQRHITFRGLP